MSYVSPSKAPLLANYARNGAPASGSWRTGVSATHRFNSHRSSGFAVDLGPPPADADEQESPVAEEFGRLAFKGVTDELEDPSEREQRQRVKPQPMIEKSDEEDPNRNQNGRNAKGVAEAIDGMLVTARVSRDPLLIAISAQHADKMILRLEPVGHGMA